MQLGRCFMVFQLRSAASWESGCYLFIVVGGSVGSGGCSKGGTQKKHGKKKTGKGAKDFSNKFLGDDLGGR